MFKKQDKDDKNLCGATWIGKSPLSRIQTYPPGLITFR